MSTYLRIIDSKNETYCGWKDAYGYWNTDITTREHHINVAKNFSVRDLKLKLGFLEYCKSIDKPIYPMYIQVVRKKKYKNDNITKKVIYEKEIK